MDIALASAGNPNQVKDILTSIESLETKIAKTRESLKIISYKLPTDKYKLTVDGDTLVQGNNPWFSLTLAK